MQGVGLVLEGSADLPNGTPVWFATNAGMQPGDGSMRALAAVPEHDVVALPPGADPVLVAALGLSAVAAWMALTFRGGLTAGEQVLVLGAGGVVGQAAVQLAPVRRGGRVVAAAAVERVPGAGARAWARTSSVTLGDVDDVAEPGRADAARTARSTWSSTRCSASPPPRPCARCARTAGW